MHTHLIDTLRAIAGGTGTLLPDQAAQLLHLAGLVAAMSAAELTFMASHDDPTNTSAGPAYDQAANAVMDFWRGPEAPPAGQILHCPAESGASPARAVGHA